MENIYDARPCSICGNTWGDCLCPITAEHSILNQPKPNIEIWIADDVSISCVRKYNWFHKMMTYLLLGWKVKKIKK